MIDRMHARALAFSILAVGISGTALVLAQSLAHLDNPGAVAAGITLDLTLLVPLAYYFLVVRPRKWPPVALAPVIVLSLLIAAAILPPGYQRTLRLVEAVAIPVEVCMLGWIGWQAARALRRVGGHATADPIEALHRSAKDLLRMDRAADVLASELAVLFYAFGAWRSHSHIPKEMRAFTSHKRSGHGGLLLGLLVLMVAEGVVVHLILARWSLTSAWIVTLLSLYGALWLIADYRATVLRPLLGNETEVWFRAGLRWRVRVPRHLIVGIGRKPSCPQACTRSLAFVTPPNLWVQFSAPVSLEGPYGIRRQVSCLGVFVDEPAELEGALAVNLSEA